MCDQFQPDNVFRRFEVVEFPTSFVGLSTTMNLDVGADLTTSAYLKTMYDGKLLKFDEARELSAAHRAYKIDYIDNFTIEITFTPSNECISKAKRNYQCDNRFVFDVRLIHIDGIRCCNDEAHSEIGRYYVSGQYEYNQISHYPKTIDFGNIIMNTKETRCVRVKNDSNVIAAKFQYVRVSGCEVFPAKFTLPPNSSRRVTVTVKPKTFKQQNCFYFRVRNPHDIDKKSTEDDDNFLTYNVTMKWNVVLNKKPVLANPESLHKICEPEIKYTYIDDELTTHLKHKAKATDFLQICKASHKVIQAKERLCTGTVQCYPEIIIKPKPSLENKYNFCKKPPQKINTYEVFDVFFLPFNVDFGKIGLNTYGENQVLLKNNSKYDVLIKLFEDNCILYTEHKVTNFTVKLKPTSETKIKLFCLGYSEGSHSGIFEYAIDNKYQRKHPYKLQVGTPTLFVQERCLKFGMVTNESFTTSVPVRICNNYNLPVSFLWEEYHADTPFEIIPSSGSIPHHTSKICDVIYVCKATKSKTHEVNFVSEPKGIIPIELNIITRKLSIKFLQPAVFFKDIALNLETTEKVKLENSSREIALFYVVEPLIPGLIIEPMSGTIRPKTLMTFEIKVKISCVLEFSFDIYVKINNKENVILPVSGNVVEPKILIHPKNIYMSRVPCYMITYVPVTFQNLTPLRSVIEVLDTGDDNIFNVYIHVGNEKQRVLEFNVEGGQTKTVFIKVYDIFRREYEMYVPFKINGLLGPPNENSWSTELQHYIGEYEQIYDNNPKVKVKAAGKDISFCRIMGVITVPWIEFSVDHFEISYKQNGRNCIEFTMRNVSKYYLHVTILTAKLAPNFSLDLITEEHESIVNETHIKFELDRGKEAALTMKFHPKGHGRFIAVAMLFLDKHMTIPYYNLEFKGKRATPAMIPSTYRIVFPPCRVGRIIRRTFTIKLEEKSDIDSFYCTSKEEKNLTVSFVESKKIKQMHKTYTIVTTEIVVCCETAYARCITVNFYHECGSGCDVEISFCFTHCILTLHSNFLVEPEDNPYPYYPLSTQPDLYDYMENCSKFLEKWMFQQGFRRDLYPIIPDTFHAISTVIGSGTKTKGINVTYLNFVRRIAGPLMKHVRKISATGVDESFKYVKETHDSYKEIIKLLESRGADLWVLKAKFLLSYEQFVTYNENVTPKCNADIILIQELLADRNLFDRLNKQSWIDFILQSYKVFIMDSCFFECVCLSSLPRDIIKVIVEWYNEQVKLQHKILRGKDKPVKVITNITSDLSDGIAVISAILNYCPFMKDYFNIFCEINKDDEMGGIVNNACLIIEALNQLRFYFPITSKDFIQPNFLQMLFLSIHLYVALPMFKPKDHIKFSPPLLRSSTRQVAISPSTQESLLFNLIILNNNKNNFIVEKAPSGDNGKKMYLNIKYVANFVNEEHAILLVHGYNKTRIFDTYIIFVLHGHIGLLNPVRKCKVTGPLYRPNKVDVLVSSPFALPGSYKVYITDIEPTIPVTFNDGKMSRFYLQRLNLIDRDIHLSGLPKETGQDIQEHKLYLQIICLSTQIGNTWIWFRGELGEFFIRVTTQSRWDLAIDTLQSRMHAWPIDPCSCGEACECYRTTVLMVPHRNELMLKAMRYALLEHASPIMMDVFDRLIETTTGKLVLGMLLAEGGTNMSDVRHILQSEVGYRVTSRALIPRVEHVRLAHHTPAMLALPITIPADDKAEKYSVTFTSDCGMDIRTYRIFFISSNCDSESTSNSRES